MVRVAIVDDDLWVREGRASALARAAGISVVFTGDHVEALDRPTWEDIEVVLVDAHDPGADFDRYRGVMVVAKIRQGPAPGPRVVVLTGHSKNDLLRIRMAEAGADEMHAHDDVRTVADLVALAEGRAAPATLDGATARAKAGLAPGARLNEAVSWADDNLGEDAIAPGQSQKSLPVSRRRLITARSHLARATGLGPQNGSAANRRLPAWQEVAEFLQRARGAAPKD